MDSTMPRRTIVALTAIALLALPTTAAASGDGKDYTKNGATGDYAYGPGPAKDYDKNAATGAYSGWRSTEPRDAAPSTEPVSPSPAQVVATVPEPGGLDWGDAAIGAGVGATLACSAFGLTAVVRRRRIVSLGGAGSSGVAQ